jgi:hypothetical protein
MQSVQFDTGDYVWVCALTLSNVIVCVSASWLDLRCLLIVKTEGENSGFLLCSKRLGRSTDRRHRARASGIKLVKGCNTVAMTIEWSVGYGLDSWQIVCYLVQGRDCLFCKIQTNLWAIRPPIQWVLATFLSGIKWRGMRPTESAAVVKNECRHTYNTPTPREICPHGNKQVKYSV